MRTKDRGIPLGTTIIVNQGASNHVPERPTTNMFAYYTYIPPEQLHYQLVQCAQKLLTCFDVPTYLYHILSTTTHILNLKTLLESYAS